MNDQIVKNDPISSLLSNLSPDSTLAIISPTSFEKLDENSQLILQKFPSSFTSNLSYESILGSLKFQPKTVLGIGGGTAIDFSKFIAKYMNSKCIAVPSMLSTNAFATNKVAVSSNSSKHTESGVLPHEVWIDQEYLAKSPQENLYGLLDVFSIFSALRDWEYAQKYQGIKIVPDIFKRALVIMIQSIIVAKHENQDIFKLFSVIRDSGYITNEYGSGRPESGSEHIFASALESLMDIPHAFSVTLGLHIMEFFNFYGTIKSSNPFSILPFNSLGIIEKINQLQIPWVLIKYVLNHLQPRSDKFTLIDIIQDFLSIPNIQESLHRKLIYYGFKFFEE